MPATEIPFITELTAVGDNAPSLDRKFQILKNIQGASQELGNQVDLYLLDQIANLRVGITQCKTNLDKCKVLLEKMAAPPWFLGVDMHSVTTPSGPRAMVICQNAMRMVGFAEGADPAALSLGDEVFLSAELNVVMSKCEERLSRCGETALFDRRTPDGRIVVKWRDDEVVVHAAADLRAAPLASGDVLRWDRSSWVAFEKVERKMSTDLFLEETPRETFSSIGGLGPQIAALKQAIEMHMLHLKEVSKYHLRPKRSVLLVGPPGTGKTMTARALTNWLATRSQSGRSRFINIKSGALHLKWFSESEANYRQVFSMARCASEEEPGIPVTLFFDEVDSIGATRGASLMRVDDKALDAFMTELDGLEARGNILVVAATNRFESLDPGLVRPGRLGDKILEVPRPGMSATRDILSKYLHPDIPYAENGHGSDTAATRQEIIDSAAARIFASNGDNSLATIRFRDGKSRTIGPPDLVSGAVLSKIVMTATERACVRELETGRSGVRPEDVYSAIDEEFETAASVLAPVNCRSHLSGLPQDVDVVAVEPTARKVRRPHHYVNSAAG